MLIACAYAATAALPLFIALLSEAALLDDAWWDALMAIGYLSMGGVALLPLATGRMTVRFDRTPHSARFGFEWHELLSYLLLAAVLAHAVGVAVYQPITIEYIKLSAPAYMLAGVVATLLLLLMLWLSIRPRRWDSLRLRYLRDRG